MNNLTSTKSKNILKKVLYIFILIIFILVISALITGTAFYGAPETIEKYIDSSKNLAIDGISGATLTCNIARTAIKNAIEYKAIENKKND